MTKKIMFNDKYCLTRAVLAGRKTMTRRVLKIPKTCNNTDIYDFNVLTNSLGTQCVDLLDENENIAGSWAPKYEVGEVIAIAQSYKTIYDELTDKDGEEAANEWWCNAHEAIGGSPDTSGGNNNKMFVKADLMPHHIKITDIKVERLQDISDEDIMREGVKRASIGFYAEGVKVKDCEKEAHRETASGCLKLFPFPRPAFASLIDKISGKGTWESNPWVAAYSFELVD